MRKQGSVTVTFSLVFLLMFSFILSFFEMAAYTARRSFHAAAARLATENYFAGYTAPMYSEYHIFGKEVPKGEEIEEWTEQEILRDVMYMTQKKEGQASLLLRSGADYSVSEAKVLTQNGGDGFYRQATQAMRYRSILEIADMVKQYLGLSKQMEGHMTVMAQQAEVAGAYATVEKEVLKLIELVDGVKLSQYELFLRGQATVFQAEYYVKFLCSEPGKAEACFDRYEVYDAFCNTYINPAMIFSILGDEINSIAAEVEQREKQQEECSKEWAGVVSEIERYQLQITEADSELDGLKKEKSALEKEQKALRKKSRKTEEEKNRITEISALLEQKKRMISEKESEKTALATEKAKLEEVRKEVELRKKELEKEAKEQEKRVLEKKAEEAKWVTICGEVRKKCAEALVQTGVVKKELELAILAKQRCDALLEKMRPVLGDDAIKSYSEELEKYRMYESAQGYDFDKMEKTLDQNRLLLEGIVARIGGTDSSSLYRAGRELGEEGSLLKDYSFEGLRMNYGEISLAGSVKDQAVKVIENAMSNSFLSLLTEEALADGQLELSYLPSKFRYAGEEPESVLALLGKDLGAVFSGLAGAFSGEGELSDAAAAVTDPLLFHAYLMTHFGDHSNPNEDTALRYELEYLISGRSGDRENLSNVIMKICFLRTAQHLVSLYSDSARKAPAEAAALAACGVIGLPALKEVFLFLFLLIWAVEEAMVDASALLQGKKLSLFPGKGDGSIGFSELVLFSGNLVRTRAKAKKDAIGVGLGYRDFLQLYLLMTPKEHKCFRAMDLIQENLRRWYRNSFRIKRCVWRVEYITDGKMYDYSYCE